MQKQPGPVVLALFLLSFSFVFTTYSQSSANAIIDRFIAKQAHEEGASAPKDVRKVLRGDVNGDHKMDLVALYTLEGGDYQGGKNMSRKFSEPSFNLSHGIGWRL